MKGAESRCSVFARWIDVAAGEQAAGNRSVRVLHEAAVRRHGHEIGRRLRGLGGRERSGRLVFMQQATETIAAADVGNDVELRALGSVSGHDQAEPAVGSRPV